MKVEARHGEVLFTQHIAEEHLTREEAAAHLMIIALAIVNSGDISDPKAQHLYAAVQDAVEEFVKCQH